MVKVKICGICNAADALMAAEAGADALGFVFVPPSPRYIHPEAAARIRRQLPPFLALVGVFADAPLRQVEEVAELCHLDAVQLHGAEPPSYCASLPLRVIKSFRVRDARSLEGLGAYRVEAILLDSYHPVLAGGTGQPFDWALAQEAKRFDRVILAGGLTPENVAEAIRRVRPYAVDVSSGVEERPGVKEERKVRAFFEEVARAAQA